jgi:hypothetical protein
VTRVCPRPRSSLLLLALCSAPGCHLVFPHSPSNRESALDQRATADRPSAEGSAADRPNPEGPADRAVDKAAIDVFVADSNRSAGRGRFSRAAD